jgi:hypothetical protein
MPVAQETMVMEMSKTLKILSQLLEEYLEFNKPQLKGDLPFVRQFLKMVGANINFCDDDLLKIYSKFDFYIYCMTASKSKHLNQQIIWNYYETMLNNSN